MKTKHKVEERVGTAAWRTYQMIYRREGVSSFPKTLIAIAESLTRPPADINPAAKSSNRLLCQLPVTKRI